MAISLDDLDPIPTGPRLSLDTLDPIKKAPKPVPRRSLDVATEKLIGVDRVTAAERDADYERKLTPEQLGVKRNQDRIADKQTDEAFDAVRAKQIASEPKYQSFGKALLAGIDDTQKLVAAGVEATGEVLGGRSGKYSDEQGIADAFVEYGREGREQNAQEADQYGPRGKFADISTVGDAFAWATQTAGNMIPVMVPAMVGGAAGATLAPAAGVTATVGGIVGAFIPSVVVSTGEVQASAKDKDPTKTANGWTFAGGTAIAALDSVLPGRIGGKLVEKFGREAAEEIAMRALLRPAGAKLGAEMAKGALKEGSKSAAIEGLTESVQEAIGEVAASLASESKIDWQGLPANMLESGAAGALMGGGTGAPSGAITAAKDVADANRMNEGYQAGVNREAAGLTMPTAVDPEADFKTFVDARNRAVRPAPNVDVPLTDADRASALPDNLIQAGKNAVADALEANQPKPVKKPLPKVEASFDRMVQIVLGLEGGGTLANPKTSPKGARGPMQVMPLTNSDPGFGVRPAQNNSEAERARVGRDYLAAMLRRYNGDPAKALAAYNGGPGRVDDAIAAEGANWLSVMPAESRKYAMNGLSKLGAQGFDPATGEVAAQPVPEQIELDKESAEDYARRVLGDDIFDTAPATETDPASLEVEQAITLESLEAKADALTERPIGEIEQQGADLRGDPIDEEFVSFAQDSGTLGVPRAEMPQIKAENRGAMVNYLKARNVTSTKENVPAAALKPTQQEFSPSKVQKAKEFTGGNRSILVSSDNYVLDGHHQWLAARDNGENIDTLRLDAPIAELIPLARDFPSSELAEGATGQAIPQGEFYGQSRAIGTGKKPTRRGGGFGTFLEYITDIGGVRDDEGNSLSKMRGMQQGIAGAGSLIRANGLSIDQIGERAFEDGWFKTRPTTREVLDLLEEAQFRKVYNPLEDADRREEDAQAAQDTFIEQVQGIAADFGVTLNEDELRHAATKVKGGMAVDDAVMSAVEWGAARDLPAILAATNDAEYDIPFDGESVTDEQARKIDESLSQGSERPQADAGTAPEREAAPQEPDGDSQPEITDSASGKGVVVRGATEAQLAAIKAALPEKASGMVGKGGAVTYSKKHEDKIRAALAGSTTSPAAPTRAKKKAVFESTPTGLKVSNANNRDLLLIRQATRDGDGGRSDGKGAILFPKSAEAAIRARFAEDEARPIGQWQRDWENANDDSDREAIISALPVEIQREMAAKIAAATKPEYLFPPRSDASLIVGYPGNTEIIFSVVDTNGKPLGDAPKPDFAGAVERNLSNEQVDAVAAIFDNAEKRNKKPTAPETADTPVERARNVYKYILKVGGTDLGDIIKPAMWREQMQQNAAASRLNGFEIKELPNPFGLRVGDRVKTERANEEAYIVTMNDVKGQLQYMLARTNSYTGWTIDVEPFEESAKPAPAAPSNEIPEGVSVDETRMTTKQEKEESGGDFTAVASRQTPFATARGFGNTSLEAGRDAVRRLGEMGQKAAAPTGSENRLPSGWTQSSAGGIATSTDPKRGGIVDKAANGKWFVVANDDAIGTLEGFDMRSEAFGALYQAAEKLSDAAFTANEQAAPAVTSKPATWGASNKGVTRERAAQIREELKAELRNVRDIGRDESGTFNPKLLALGTELAAFHIEAGARKFADFAKAIAEDLGMTMTEIKPYLRAWYVGAQAMMEDAGQDVADMDGPGAVKAAITMIDDATPAAVAPQTDSSGDRAALMQAFMQAFIRGEGFTSITEARKLASETLGRKVEAGTADAKMLDEAIETAVVQVSRKIAIENADDAPQAYQRLVGLYNRQPKLGVRTSTSIEQQAYSTPPPLSFLASRLAGINQNTTVYEPSAGNGALLIDARATYVTANELNPDRAAALRRMFIGATVTEGDAMADNLAPKQFDVVIGNPPFGPVKDGGGNSVEFEVAGFTTKEIDHAIALKALEKMKDDGSAVLIVGGINKMITDPKARADAYNGKAKRDFYFRLYSQYNVVDHFTADGSLYERQGAGWPVDLIVIKGRGKSALSLPAVRAPRQYNSWQELTEVLSNERPQEATRPVRATDGEFVAERTGPATVDAGNTGSSGIGGTSGRIGSDTTQQPEPVRDGPVDGQPDSIAVGGTGDGVVEPVSDQRQRRVDREDTTGLTENARQVIYQPGSDATAMGTLVPVNMQTAVDTALDVLRSRVGNIDDYVATQLGYNRTSLYKAFAAEQIDALALAIHNIEDKGAGFIIGDQTGIGKGRVVAGVIRYAMRQGRPPIFVTEKANLFADIYRDLVDIGVPDMLGRDLNIVMTNAGESVPLGEGLGELKSKGSKAHTALLQKLAAEGLQSEGVDVLFTTYSQMQTVKGEVTERQRVLDSLSQGGVLLLDESHNAGGTTGGFKKAGAPLNRAEFVRKLVGKAHGVFYSSATYAKRPDVMSLYAATDMRLAVKKIEDLGDAIGKGGVPMQQVVAAMLARAGQYVRRERSFEGIAYNTPIVEVDRNQYAATAGILSSIQSFSEDYVGAATEKLDEQLRAEGETLGFDNAVGKAGASSTNFTAIMHNVIDQMLLAFSADATADRAIAAIENGEKPVITVANTLESMLDQYAEVAGINIGDEMQITFADVFRRYLERSRWITIKKPQGYVNDAGKEVKSERVRLTDGQLGSAGVAAFRETMQMIDEAGLESLPGSPIDYILSRIQDAGYKVGEITGRGTGINYRNGKAYLKVRPDAERSIKGRLKTINGFNDGSIDVVLLNRSGSTGLSLHASEKFKDKRKRRMIIAQAEGNIDTHMQMLGRVHRTGQVVLPEYDQIVIGVPAAKRPAANLARKMASLNASTTASRDSALTSKESVDFMNVYGDQVVAAIMQEEPDIHRMLAEPLAEEDEGYMIDGAARKVTGRIPLLPVEMQEELYDRIESEYKALLEQKEASGENALEAKTYDLQARVVSTQQVVDPNPDDPNSPFGEAVYAETVSVKRLGKPYTSEQVIERLAEANGLDVPAGEPAAALKILFDQIAPKFAEETATALKAGQEWAADDIEMTKDNAAKEKRREKNGDTLRDFRALRALLVPGRTVRILTENGNFYGTVSEGFKTGKAKNPLALGSWKAKIDVVDAARSLTFPFSQLSTTTMEGGKVKVEAADSIGLFKVIDAYSNMQVDSREERLIINGNMLAGFDYVKGRGAIINYTTEDGDVKQGIMLNKDFDLEKHIARQPISFTTADMVLAWLETLREPLVGTGKTGSVSLFSNQYRGEFTVVAAKSKKVGGEFFLNTNLTRALGRDFVSRSNGMVAEVSLSKAKGVIETLLSMGVDFSVEGSADDNVKERAREIVKQFAPKPKMSLASGAKSEKPANDAIRALAAEEGATVEDGVRLRLTVKEGLATAELRTDRFGENLEIIDIKSPGQGAGTKLMNRILAAVDNAGAGVFLYAKGYDRKSTRELFDWYRSFGFGGQALRKGQGNAPFAPEAEDGIDMERAAKFSLFDDPEQPQKTMTDKQRAELEARQKQGMARKGGQTGLGDQDGGLFSSERDQGTLFSRPANRIGGNPEGFGRRVVDQPAGFSRPAVRNLQAELNKLGIGDRVMLKVAGKLLNNEYIRGTYYKNVISIATSKNPNPFETLNHEAIHALKDLGLFKPAEWRALEQAALADKAMMSSIRSRYGREGLTESEIIEEGVADMFAAWRAGTVAQRGFIRDAFERIVALFRALRRAITGANAQDEAARIVRERALNVMKAIDSAEIGSRRSPFEGLRRADAPRFSVAEPVESDAFKKWFGASKVVDADGKPLIVYHGTGADFSTFNIGNRGNAVIWASPDPAQAERFATGDLMRSGSSPNIMPLYMGVQKPFDPAAAPTELFPEMAEMLAPSWLNKRERERAINGMLRNFRNGDFNSFIVPGWVNDRAKEFLAARGFDGVVRRDSDGGVAYAAFEPEQIKSAIGNNGEFDPNNSDIRYSITGRLIGEGVTDKIIDRLDRWRTNLQDRMLPLLRAQQRVEAQSGIELDEAANPYLAEELMSGKVGARLERLTDEMVTPLFDSMKAEGIDADELETYLYARHAVERNARISQINSQFEEGTGSGMTDAEAGGILTMAEAEGKLPALERLAERVDEMLRFAVQTRVEAGLLSQEEADAWAGTYQFYVPLRGFAEIEPEAGEAERPRAGSGINVRGPESKRAFGRTSKAADILAYSIMQAEEAIVRAGRNEVAQAFYQMVKANPDPEFWTTKTVRRTPVWNEKSGTVSYRTTDQIDPQDADYTVSLKIDGQERRVTMNRENPKAVQLAVAMRNLDGQDLGSVMRVLSGVNRYLSFVNTGLNPEFVITNAFRDIQTAGINLAQFDRAGLVAGTLKDYRKALVASVRGSFKNPREGTEWAGWYDEFLENGGRVYFNRVDDMNELRKRIEKQMQANTGTLGVARSTFTNIKEFIENANMGVENGIRLSAYKNARERGMSPSQAASLAKNLTVNFNRRGAWGVAMNSLYLFYNASVQGSARLLQASFAKGRGGNRVRMILGAAVAIGYGLDMLNMMLSDDDDDGESFYDKVSDFDKSRNLIIMLPGERGKHVKIPLPYGYNAFYALGRAASQISRGEDWKGATGMFLQTVVDAFNPVGGTDNIMNLVAPTIADPIVDLTRNRDFADRPIMPEDGPYAPETPDSQKYWDSISPHYRVVTDTLNSMTGGDEVIGGAIDVSPETLQHLSGVVTGAAGVFFIDRIGGLVEKTVTGEEITANDLPLVRKVVGTKPSWYDKAAFYDRMNQIENVVADVKEYRTREEDDKADAYEDSNADVLDMVKPMKAAKKEMRKLKKERGKIELQRDIGEITAEEAAAEIAFLRDEEKLIIEEFNADYIATIAKPKRP